MLPLVPVAVNVLIPANNYGGVVGGCASSSGNSGAKGKYSSARRDA